MLISIASIDHFDLVLLDQRSARLTVTMKSNSWPIKALCYMLDVSRVNAQTILSLNRDIDPRTSNTKDFLWNLSIQLLKPLLIRRRISPCYKLLTNGVKVTVSILFEHNDNLVAALI